MQPDNLRQTWAKRNLRLNVLLSTLSKRTYLPLSAVYFVQVCGLSLLEIGQLAAFFALVMFISDLPTGYLADRIGRARCIRIGAALGMVAMTCFILFQNKLGVFTGVFFEGIAYGFLTGAGAGLVHDSLEVTNSQHLYSKIMSRTQSISLVVSAGLTALVPLSYVIDPRLPFGLGAVAFAILAGLGFAMHDVRKSRPGRLQLPALRVAMRKRALLVFALVLGLVSAVYWGPAEQTKLALNEFGVRPEFLGWFFTGSSMVGALMGLGIHKLKELPLPIYAGIDALLASALLAAAFSQSLLMFGSAFVIVLGFWRYRRIIYQHHLLEIYPTRYKGTLFALMSSSEELNTVWASLVIGGVIAHYGLSMGLGMVGVASLALMPAIILASMVLIRKRPQMGSL